MSIWGWITGKNGHKNGSAINGEAPSIDIPEDVFTEKTEPKKESEASAGNHIRQDNIQTLFDFLSKDYQQVGYDDALVNPDTSYRDENIQAILSDLDIIIRRVKTYYEDALKELDFLIESRNRLGMVDLVDELKMKKSKAEDHYEKTLEMQKEASQQLGSSQRVIISYRRGFHNGMAAIGHHESNKWKF
jgi:hypothetical protein